MAVQMTVFGFSVSSSGNNVIIGSHNEDTSAMGSGAAYIFQTTDNGESWTLVQMIKANDPATGDNFGTSVSHRWKLYYSWRYERRRWFFKLR